MAAASKKTVMVMVSSTDLESVIDLLRVVELQHLFHALGLRDIDIEKAEEGANTKDVNLRARAVLQWWHQRNGQEATRGAILKALDKCKYRNAKEELEITWKPEEVESSIKGRRSKALQCSICLQRFKSPKTLPCLHSFCKECLVGCAPRGKTTISCPLCRKAHPIQNGDVTQFPSNFHLEELVVEEATREKRPGGGSDFTCTCCDNPAVVVAKCQICKQYLCETGLSTHRRDHQLVVFEMTTEEATVSTVKAIVNDKPELELITDDWAIFDALYDKKNKKPLYMYWKKRQGKGSNWQKAMTDHYLEGLTILEESGLLSEDLLIKRHAVAVILFATGQYDKALEVIEKALDTENKNPAKRPENLASLYFDAADIYTNILNSITYVKDKDPAIIRKQLEYARLSLKLRKTMDGEDNKFELGRVLRLLSGALSLWWSRGGDSVLSATDARTEGMKYIDESIEIFKQLNAKGNAASSIMTKATLEERGSEEKEKLYREAIAMCEETYGECSVLSGDLHWNMCVGVYEVRMEYHEAYNWLVKCKDIYVKVYGRHHPQTQKVYDRLEEDIYVEIRKELEAGK